MSTGPVSTGPASGGSERAWDTDDLPQGEAKVAAVRQMFDAIAPRYDLVNRIMTFRLDVRWRRKAVRLLALPAGSTVLDLASGTGDLCIDLARAGHRPLSCDLSFGMLSADRSGAPRIQADILRLPVPDATVDGVTCGFALRNLVDLPTFFAELARVVRPGGRIALLDVGIPKNPLIRWGNGIYFGKVVPKIGALLSDAPAYRYLPKSVAYLPAPEQMVADLRAAGFHDAEHRLLSGGLTQLLTGTRVPSTAERTTVRAVTRRLDEPVDLNDIARGDGHLFVRDGIGVAGRGVAALVPREHVASFLAGIEHDSDVDGVAPIALGALPFEPDAAADLVVPSLLVGKSADGRRWITLVGEGPFDDLHEVIARPRPAAAVARFTIGEAAPVEQYLAAVATARDAVAAGELAKAVIAREVMVGSDRPIDVHAVLIRLRASFGSSYRYSIDGFVGASPELLVRVDGNIVESHPLAGTAPRTGDPATDARIAAELIASTKNQVEHRSVIEMVHDTLLPWCSYLDWEPEPSIVTVANVQHLGSRVEGWLSEPRPHVLDLVHALLPTPALGGAPRAAALELIDRVEGFRRGRYGGAVGWVDGHGNGTWAVSIRCAELSADRRRARLVAGGGIVAASDPEAELAETQAKLQAMLSAIVRP